MAKLIEAENALRDFVKVFYNDTDRRLEITEPDTHSERLHIDRTVSIIKKK